MDIFENYETIIYFTEALLEGYEAYKSQKLGDAVQALKDLRRVENSARRKAQTNAKKLPGKIKKAEQEFDDAHSKTFDEESKFRSSFETPEGKKARNLFQKIKVAHDKGKSLGELEKQINKYREASNKHTEKLNPELEKHMKPYRQDTEEKRKKMYDLKVSADTNKDNLIDKSREVADLQDKIDALKG